MEVLYKDIDGELLTEQQIKELDAYCIECYLNGILEKEELILSGRVASVKIYNNSNQPHPTILASYGPSFGLAIVDIEMISNYKLLTYFDYNRTNTLESKWIELYDLAGNRIGKGKSDANDNIDFSTLEKYYWDFDRNRYEPVFLCSYDANTGQLESFYFTDEATDHVNQTDFTLYNNPSDIQEIMDNYGVSQTLMDYYLSPDIRPNFNPPFSA